MGQVWWYILVPIAPWRLRLRDHKVKGKLIYIGRSNLGHYKVTKQTER